MRPEKHFDELFRSGLRSVPPPEPPVLDWTAMASAAHESAATRGAKDKANAALRRNWWWRISAGAGIIIGLWWYGARQASVAPVMMNVEAVDIGSNPKELPTTSAAASPMVTSGAVRNAPDVDPVPIPPEQTVLKASTRVLAVPSGKAIRAVTGSDVAQDVDAKDAAEIRSLNEASAPTAAGITVAHELPSEPDKRVDPSGIASVPMIDNAMVLIVQTPNRGSIEELEPIADTHPRVSNTLYTPTLLPVLIPVAQGLSTEPLGTADPGTIGAMPFARFTISPWVALDHSILHDNRSGSVSSADQLISAGDLSHRIGVRFEYAIHRRVSVITGLQYAQKGALIGTVITSPLSHTEYSLSGTYWEVPLSIKFTMPRDGMELYVRTGILLQFNSSQGDRVIVHDDNGKETSTLTLSSTSMGPALDLGAGIRFRLGRGIGVFIEPSYQYALTPIVKHPSFDRLPFNPRIHTFGLGTGLSFQFHSR